MGDGSDRGRQARLRRPGGGAAAGGHHQHPRPPEAPGRMDLAEQAYGVVGGVLLVRVSGGSGAGGPPAI